MDESETVEVCLKLPAGTIRFLKALGIDVEEYLANTCVEGFKADLNAMEGPFWELIMKQHPELEQWLGAKRNEGSS